jgi:hypothetical protein
MAKNEMTYVLHVKGDKVYVIPAAHIADLTYAVATYSNLASDAAEAYRALRTANAAFLAGVKCGISAISSGE